MWSSQGILPTGETEIGKSVVCFDSLLACGGSTGSALPDDVEETPIR